VNVKLIKKKPKFKYKYPNEPCEICKIEIPHETFALAGEIGNHTDYEFYVLKKRAINFEGMNYHWDCFMTTERGKIWAQKITERQDKDRKFLNEINKKIRCGD